MRKISNILIIIILVFSLVGVTPIFDGRITLQSAAISITLSKLPEINGTIPDIELPEDAPPFTLDLTQYESDGEDSGTDLDWYFMNSDSSLYNILGEYSDDDLITIEPLPNQYGTSQVTVCLVDSDGKEAKQDLWINITPVNDPPCLNGQPDLEVHYDDQYTFDFEPYIEDVDTSMSKITLEVFDDYGGIYFEVSGFSVTFNYPYELIDETIQVKIKLSDGEETVEDVFSVQVTGNFAPQLIQSLPDVWLYEGQTKYNVFNLDNYFSDRDSNVIYFSYGQTHTEIIINENHTVDISGYSEWTGSEFVTFRAFDAEGALTEDTIIVTVLPVNSPPVIKDVPDFVVHYDQDYRFDLTSYVYDSDNTTDELTISVSDPEHIRNDIQNNMVIILNYPTEYIGQNINVQITVSDGLDSSFQKVMVTITDNYPPELLSPLPDIVFLEDEALVNAIDLDDYFLDIDGDVLYYTIGNNNITITIHSNHTVDFSATDNWYGEELVYFRAVDPAGAIQQDLILVTVLPVNDPPIIHELPPIQCNTNEILKFDLSDYIFDIDNSHEELEVNVKSDNLDIEVFGLEILIYSPIPLTETIKVIVSDGLESTDATQKITITGEGAVTSKWTSNDIVITESTNYQGDNWYSELFSIIKSTLDANYIDSNIVVTISKYTEIQSLILKVETAPDFIKHQMIYFDLKFDTGLGDSGTYSCTIKKGGINKDWLTGIYEEGNSILSLLSTAIEPEPDLYITEAIITDISGALHEVDLPDKKLTSAKDVLLGISQKIDLCAFYGSSSVDLEVYDDDSLMNNEGNAYYSGPSSDPEFVIIANPTTENYKVKVTGTDDGTYSLVSRSMDNGEVIDEKIEENIPISDGEKQNKDIELLSPTLEKDQADEDKGISIWIWLSLLMIVIIVLLVIGVIVKRKNKGKRF